MSSSARIVDARGMLCPWPVLRLCRAVREHAGAESFLVLADDPAADREIAQLCKERGWGFSHDANREHAFNVVIF
jgi:tRNA 2-thiouridine synthesizing protein A